MHTAAMKVFAIPEVQDIISRFIDTSDRLHLSTTNQLCNQTASPLLWATLDLFDTHDQPFQPRQRQRQAPTLDLEVTSLALLSTTNNTLNCSRDEFDFDYTSNSTDA
ncbi:hypothetical protein BGX30_015203 [Mortierella sp. GBA39]|nr:hypothetical protein BGX30_015203 [Mortierella sp. GBA39]